MVIINNNPKKNNREVSFLFKIKNKFYEYILTEDNKEDILNLCNKIDKTQYKSINKMLLDIIYKENSINLNVNELDKKFVMECANNLDINDLFEPYQVNIFKDLEKVHFDKNGYNNILDKYLNKEHSRRYNEYCITKR